ncbi:thioredoxin, partial [Candidatus Roizmanbacteria bacterium CG_4_10_14_0_2_um_filter_39_12]
ELGVQGTPGFFINGRFLGGAFPFEVFKEIIDKELAGTSTGECLDYSEELQQYCQDEQNQAFKPVAVEVAVGDSPAIGSKNAKVTIVEFSDFECPFCARAFATVKQIKDAYPKDVKIVYKQLPLTNIHPNAQKAAEASICAKDQGKFWEMHDKMFESQGA